MGYICSCSDEIDKSANIDISINNDGKNREMGNNIDRIKNRNYENKIKIENLNISINNIKNKNNNNELSNNDSNCENSKKESEIKQSNLSASFNINKSISPSNNPLDGLVKLIPRNEQ